MVMLASSPSTASGVVVRCENSTFETCRGRNVFRKSQKNASHIGMVRFNGMDGYKSGRSHCETVPGVVRAGLLEGKSGGVRGEEAVKDDYLVSMLPTGSAVAVNVTNLGNNTRKVEAKIAIHAPLEAVWGVLTDYDRLSDHIPGLAESQVLERRPHGARLMQVGQKNLALGVKFKAKAVVEVTEEEPQDLHDGILRDLHFDTVEGDFQVFKGTWRMHQVNMKPGAKDRVQTYLSYILEVQPKKWIPVALIEGVVCHEITCNLTSVRSVALRHKHVHGSH